MQSSLFYNNITVLLLPFLLHACCRFCCIVVAVLTVSFLADFTAFVLSDYKGRGKNGEINPNLWSEDATERCVWVLTVKGRGENSQKHPYLHA